MLGNRAGIRGQAEGALHGIYDLGPGKQGKRGEWRVDNNFHKTCSLEGVNGSHYLGRWYLGRLLAFRPLRFEQVGKL